jgi:hypothetical protein
MMDGSNISHRVSGWLSGGGALSGFFAFLGASCCVVPILLVHFGVATGIVAQLVVSDKNGSVSKDRV